MQYGRPYRNPRCAGAQSQKYQRRRAVERNCWRCGRFGLGQIFARAGRAVRRGLASLSRGALDLHAPPHDPGGKGTGRRNFICPRRACAAPAPRCARDPQHVRHGHGTFEQPAPHVFPSGKSPLSQRALRSPYPRRCRRAGARLPRVRRKVLCALGRGARVQQPGRVSDVRRHGHCAHGGQEHARARRNAHHRRGRRCPVELAHVVAHDRRVPRHGRAHGRALLRAHRAGEGHCVQRPRRKEAHIVPCQELRRRHRARLHLLQRGIHGGERALQGQGRERHEAR